MAAEDLASRASVCLAAVGLPRDKASKGQREGLTHWHHPDPGPSLHPVFKVKVNQQIRQGRLTGAGLALAGASGDGKGIVCCCPALCWYLPGPQEQAAETSGFQASPKALQSICKATAVMLNSFH